MHRTLALLALAILTTACDSEDPKDSASPDLCAEYVKKWTACTEAAGEGTDPTLEDPAAFCETNAEKDDEYWTCVIDSIYDNYCTNIQGLTFIQGEFAACNGY
jgi:hypothetical protein